MDDLHDQQGDISLFGNVYFFIDGSTFNGRWKVLARSGLGGVLSPTVSTPLLQGGMRLWALQQFCWGGMCVWGGRHLPGKEQCNYRAEVYALLMVLLHLNSDGGWQHERLCGY